MLGSRPEHGGYGDAASRRGISEAIAALAFVRARFIGRRQGTVVDGHWRVEKIAQNTWAIGETAGEPNNYAYLLVGTRRTLLIVSGATPDHDIRRAIAGLTSV